MRELQFTCQCENNYDEYLSKRQSALLLENAKFLHLNVSKKVNGINIIYNCEMNICMHPKVLLKVEYENVLIFHLDVISNIF